MPGCCSDRGSSAPNAGSNPPRTRNRLSEAPTRFKRGISCVTGNLVAARFAREFVPPCLPGSATVSRTGRSLNEAVAETPRRAKSSLPMCFINDENWFVVAQIQCADGHSNRAMNCAATNAAPRLMDRGPVQGRHRLRRATGATHGANALLAKPRRIVHRGRPKPLAIRPDRGRDQSRPVNAICFHSIPSALRSCGQQLLHDDLVVERDDRV